MSCNKDTFLQRLRVLQCSNEKPFCFAAILKNIPDFLIEEYFDSIRASCIHVYSDESFLSGDSSISLYISNLPFSRSLDR